MSDTVPAILFWIVITLYWVMFLLNEISRHLNRTFVRMLQLHNRTLQGKPISVPDAEWLANKIKLEEPLKFWAIKEWSTGKGPGE